MHLWASEVRVRTINLKETQDDEQFGADTARLVDWIQQNEALVPVISSLELEEERANAPASRALQAISDELITLWDILIKLKIDYTKVPPSVIKAKEEITYKLESPRTYPILDFYHQIRIFIEGLAETVYGKMVAPYYVQSLPDKIPQLRGKIFDLYVLYNARDSEVKSLLKTSQWGAWANLRHIINLSRGDNPFWQLKEWFKLFKHDETIIHLNRVADYIFDYNERSSNGKFLTFKDHPYAEFSIFDDRFNLSGNKLDLLDYGQIHFDPTKSPSIGNTKIGQDVVRIILESGLDGETSKNICKKLNLRSNDIYSHVYAFNKRCKKQLEQGKINAYVEIIHYGKRGNTCFQFLIVSKQIYHDIGPSPSSELSPQTP